MDAPVPSERTVRSSIRFDCWVAERISPAPSAVISPMRPENSGERGSSPESEPTYSSARRDISVRVDSSSGTTPETCSARTGATGSGGVRTSGLSFPGGVRAIVLLGSSGVVMRCPLVAGPQRHLVQHLAGGHGRLADTGQCLVEVGGVVFGGRGELARRALRPEAVADRELAQFGVGGEEFAERPAVLGERDEGVVAVDGGVRVEDDEVAHGLAREELGGDLGLVHQDQRVADAADEVAERGVGARLLGALHLDQFAHEGAVRVTAAASPATFPPSAT